MNKRGLIFFGLGVALYLISNGNVTVPIATWLAPIFLLRFSRQSHAVIGQLVLFAVLLLATYPMLYGIIPPFLGLFAVILTVYYALLVFLPYLIDRLIENRIKGFVSTLVFPAAAVIVDYFAGISLGTWNSVSYTQHANLPLVQIVSVTGMWGITFLIFWAAAVVNWAWDRNFEPKRIANGALIFGSVFLAVYLYGGLRLALADSSTETVVVAAVADGRTRMEYSKALENARAVASEESETSDQEIDANFFIAFTDDLFTLTKDAADRGAKIVLWSEGVAIIPDDEESMLLDKAAMLARELRIHISLAYFKIPPDYPDTVGENKSVLIGPDGQTQWDYRKARLVPGVRENPGDGTIPNVNTYAGSTGTAICYDMDFPDLIGGANRTDLMLVPAWDWKAIDPLHTNMAVFRAVENGFNLLRSTGEGLSIAADAYGRSLARMDYFATGEEKIMLAHIPVQGTWTFYSLAGEWFAGLCMIILVIVVFLAIRTKITGKAQE